MTATAARPRRRHEGVRSRWPVVAAVVLLGAAVVAGLLVDTWREERTAMATQQVGCTAGADRTGPQVDLGVQASTDDPDRPVLPAAEVSRLADLAVDAGASVISTSLSWSVAQPEAGGDYDWTAVDRVVDAARSRGVEVRVRLVGLPTWARDDAGDRSEWRPPLTVAELERWGQFTADAVQHLRGRVRYVEVWTEPNSVEYWSTGADPVAFARLLTTTYDAVKDVDPQVQVVSGGLNGNDLGYVEALYDAIEAAGRDRRPFDLLGLHPYTNGLGPEERIPARRYERDFGTYDENFLAYRDVHGLMSERGDADVPLYIGELGYSTKPFRKAPPVADPTRARYLTQAYEAATCTPYVEALSWYYLHPTPWDRSAWTLVDDALQPNETYRALQRWSATVEEAR